MSPTSYSQSKVRNEHGQFCVGTADLWESASSFLSPGTFFPEIWSAKTKEVLDGATTLNLANGREFIVADIKRMESPKGGGHYNFQYQSK